MPSPSPPGEWVVALLFRTERAPYLVKSGRAGGGSLEVPIRSAAMTQSPTFGPGEAHSVDLDLLTHLLFEPVTTTSAFLRWHAVTVSLAVAGEQAAGKVRTYARKSASSSDAVHVRFDGIRVAEPGAISIQTNWQFPIARARELRETDEWIVRVAFQATGAQRQAEARVVLSDRRRAAYIDWGLIEDEDLHQWRWQLVKSAP